MRHRWAGTALAGALTAVAALTAGCSGSGPLQIPTPSSSPALRPHGSFELRPLVMPAVRVRSEGPGPGGALPDPLPTSASAYQELGADRQQQLKAALASVDCADPPAVSGGLRVACTAGAGEQGRPLALLTGPAILSVHDVTRARVIPPQPSIGKLSPSIALRFDRAGAAALSSFTEAHNASDTASVATDVNCGATLACSDFIAFIVDGQVVSTPVTEGRLSTGIEVSGDASLDARRVIAEING